MSTLLRLDAAFSVRRMQRTDEGFLDVWGVASRRTILAYADGERLELVTTDALDSMVETLRGAPVTLEHPLSGQVNPENARQNQRGTVLDAHFDAPSGEVRVHLRITDAEAIEEIVEGDTRELSPGYKVTLDETPGEDEDLGRYDARQIARKVNHLALTEAGRAGPDAALRVDSLIGHIMPDEKKEESKSTEADEPTDPRNDADDEGEPEEDKFDAKSRFDQLEAKVDTILDAMKPDEKEDMSDEDKQDSTDERLAWFKDRRRVLDTVAKLDLKLDSENADNLSLKKQVIESQTDMKLDSKSDDYVEARFDALVEQLDNGDAPDPFETASAKNRSRQDSADDDSPLDLTRARDAWANAPTKQ